MALSGCADGSWFHPSIPAARMGADGACPRDLGDARDVRYPANGPMGLVFDAAPASGLVCYYGPMRVEDRQPSRPLGRPVRLSAPGAVAVVDAVRRVELIGGTARRVSCPIDTGDVAVIELRYRHRRPEELWWKDSGCQTLDNGRIGASRTRNPSFTAFQDAVTALGS
jgi:hypothetical protein